MPFKYDAMPCTRFRARISTMQRALGIEKLNDFFFHSLSLSPSLQRASASVVVIIIYEIS